MTLLHNAQQLAFQQLQKGTGHHFFVRIAAQDDALWVSDLPRFSTNLSEAEALLLKQGITCKLNEQTKLWHMDWTEQKYQEAFKSLPQAIPPLPTDDQRHAAYALCRLLLLTPLKSPQPTAILRRTLKLSEASKPTLLKAVPMIHAQCAELMRQGKPLPHSAGRILAQWLLEQEVER